ncbi:hypothetical protein LCGC14_2545740 [marine sediment metagenome]|uniref:Uncharacterized protein n=1 Tax=marine sediment metagenome TaxID=412755 RepID=A0A0F9BC57_9ZZZZ
MLKLKKVIKISKNDDYKETQFSRVQMERVSRELFNIIKKEKIIEGCCFKKRVADFFLIGATRAFNKNLLPKLLTTKKKEKSYIFNISKSDPGSKTRTLTDKAEFWNIFRIMTYASSIRDAGQNKESLEWKESHNIIVDAAACTKMAEEFFKGGWSTPVSGNFQNLASSDYPDDLIIEDLDLKEEDYIEEEAEEEDYIDDAEGSDDDQ